jgi:hypothetical protein
MPPESVVGMLLPETAGKSATSVAVAEDVAGKE